MKNKVIKSIKNIAISAFVLLVLVLGGGVLYIWYMGSYGDVDTNAIATPVELKQAPVIKHTESAANAPESASIQMLTSPIVPGSNASISIKTLALSVCNISVIYDKTSSKDSGLLDKTADDFGIVSWTWTVEPSVPLGKWPVKVTCSHNNKSAVVIGDLLVVKTINS